MRNVAAQIRAYKKIPLLVERLISSVKATFYEMQMGAGCFFTQRYSIPPQLGHNHRDSAATTEYILTVTATAKGRLVCHCLRRVK